MIFVCTLALHDNVYFATREMGTLYETGRYLHNWALSYALFGAYIPMTYRVEGDAALRADYFGVDQPQSLWHLNQRGIYVFPALPLEVSYQVNTFNPSQEGYHHRIRKLGGGTDRTNFPISPGRAKELAIGSRYRTYIVAAKSTKIPRWIRLGKWASKIQVEAIPIPFSSITKQAGGYRCRHPINPLDVSRQTKLFSHNRVVMPPVSLVTRATLEGPYWKITKPENWREQPEWLGLEDIPQQLCLPRRTAYGASYQSKTAS